MNERITRIESYIQKTYQTMGERYYAFYWNQGYIHCKKKDGAINTLEERGLTAYNERVNMMESLNIGMRKDKIKKEESKRMELEGIKKRIDESMRELEIIYQSRDGFTKKEAELISDVKGISEETVKAFQIYGELVTKLYEIRYDDKPFRSCRMVECIQELEEKYYPKSKTIKQKLAAIMYKNFTSANIPKIQDALCKLHDEMED